MDFSLKALVRSPGWTQGVSQRPKLIFLEYGHVAYHIKGNDSYSKMVANILPLDTPLTPGVGSKGQTLFF